jgi:16S rRNA (guanine527-N7)-methyltransferase
VLRNAGERAMTADDLSSDTGERLEALLERYRLPATKGPKLRALAELLIGDPLAPTAIRSPTAVIDDHLADSLVALDLEPVTSARRAVDIGSGAGLPGLPLAIALPQAKFVLLESAARKASFLERAAAATGAGNVEVVHARIELWADGLGRNDLVTARALGPLELVVEYAAPLLRIGGTLVAWRGRRDEDAERAAAETGAFLGLGDPEIVQVTPYEGAEHRHLYLTSKLLETPSGFPRRAGLAVRRPLSTLNAKNRTPSDRPRR